MQRFTLPEILALRTLEAGQFDDLKLEQDGTRVWLSRMTKEDGAEYDHQVTVEAFDSVTGRWEAVDRYEPTMPPSTGQA